MLLRGSAHFFLGENLNFQAGFQNENWTDIINSNNTCCENLTFGSQQGENRSNESLKGYKNQGRYENWNGYGKKGGCWLSVML